MQKRINVSGWTFAGIISFIILSVIGWVINAVKFFGLIGQDLSTEFFARLIGIPIAPIGAILGWFF